MTYNFTQPPDVPSRCAKEMLSKAMLAVVVVCYKALYSLSPEGLYC